MKIKISMLILALIFLAGNAFSAVLTGDPTADKVELYIQRSDDQMIEMDFIFPGVNAKEIIKGVEDCDLLTLEGEGTSGAVGAPEVPIITRLFAVPDRARIRVKTFEPQYRVFSGIFPYPHQEYEYGNPSNSNEWVFDDKYYREGGFFPHKWVTLGKPAIMRDLRVIPVSISPIRVNAATGEIQVLTGLHLELEFDDGPTTNVKNHHFDKRVTSFDNIYRNTVANYDWVNPNGETVKGSLLIIYPNVAGVADTLEPLIEWKRRSGYATSAVGVPNNTSTSNVQNIIQTAYDTADPPLEHVILIGDAAGTIDVPCYYWTSGWYNGASDHQYTQLEGGDLLSDVSIGRYSVDNTNTLTTAVNKVLYYESNPMMTNTDWYKKGFVVAGSSISGLSTIQVSQNIREWWLEEGFTRVDTIWYSMGGSILTFMINQCNDGVSALNHRGYIGTNYFNTSTVMNLQNPGRLPFAVILTCGSGDFGSNDADLSEAWLRAGSPSVPKGGIGGVGTCTSGTKTRFNNCMCAGIWYGMHHEGLYELGPATARGKYELFMNYQMDPGYMADFIHWNNLMGDPTTDLWTDIPQYTTVVHPDSIPLGAASFTVTVEDDGGNPLPDRYVTLWKGTETYIGGPTDENGVFTTPIDVLTEGEMLVTVTYHNDFPYLSYAVVYESDVNPSFHSLTIDDDNSGASQGNDDGMANPSETLELDIELMNYGAAIPASAVTAVLTTEDENVTITTVERNYPNIAPGAAAYGLGKFVVELGSSFAQGYMIPFTLTVNSNQGSFVSSFEVEVNSGESICVESQFANGTLNPGDTDDLTVTIKNIGLMDLTGVTAILSSDDNHITIPDSVGTFGDINSGAEADNSADPFVISADEWATYGHTVIFNLHLTSDNGFEQDINFRSVIGSISTTDPFGPDQYGYYCVDNTDAYYSGHPVYEWIEINPHIGGLNGEQLYLPDYGNQQDISTVTDLPFEFTFYGVTFDELTVCSNGWLAFGDESYHDDFRNFGIPSVFGANIGMICAFWDNLVMSGGGVYQYYDEDNHRFIVEYCGVAHQSGGGETFQILLYDPAHYPTPTGDGEIVVQYQYVTIVCGPSTDNDYFTAGIENHDHSDGLEYAYWSSYHPAAPTLQAWRAIKYTTIEPVRSPIPTTIEVTLTPENPPIVIPSYGGSFNYEIFVENTGNEATVFDFWIWVTLPDLTQYGPVNLRIGNNLAAGALILRDMTQYVPSRAPGGDYTYTAYVGDYDANDIWDEDSFGFNKSGMDPEGDGGWTLIGWEEGELPVSGFEEMPLNYELSQARPNPFNPITEISYTLPNAGRVTLTVFNTLGRQVAVLEDGWKDAGWHAVHFNAGQLSSGIYFYTIKVDNFTQTRKMLLVK